ncbi:transketolase [Clostridium acetobutylicum]|uniref:Transketolase n=1 Tax=Clostridium acetobutylicum (strain ATCC 824 / DSM 792 / JCM 1419 / IAM 19013 / LMG 5710 / NBRC 13948 / NRRL B-527 / VKM B-1787 / 2291 / W) TaxID=272562 RepID=Q97KH5_CLOAB|nr:MULTISPECIES: transketolase [Clostridium]AAK78920.1 Transketolase [Clostridium acetobutylicum ATCC 824]ADZ19995.1 Transketolase [Clostridium acetobutylicum EA 2018]AEI34563.1 transketolase [Clostridium acetobutylicum DSM 1731]AWV80639.1 transketolase [Clostridium acetobutylicum]MBC2392829.1 transketolase [Clostridium acetobutylicum]
MNIDELSINTIRILSAEAIQKANSGHPGTPLGAAPVAYTLWSKYLKHNPSNPKWVNRDRFILSAGHASMLLYSLLHLFGYKISIDDLKNFRQWESITPGHPEYGVTPGVEISTGPLGQGIANGVGMAIAEAHLASKFNKQGFDIVDHYTYVLSGDGCMMEGIASEAASFAGTLGLSKLIVIYDDNDISIEGNTDIAFKENVGERFKAYDWNVINVEDGTDVSSLSKAIEKAKQQNDKPSIIIAKTVIGFGSPNQGTAGVHGSPLGETGVSGLKKNLNWNYEEEFYVPEEVKEHIKKLQKTFEENESNWNELLNKYKEKYPDLFDEFNAWMNGEVKVKLDEIDAFKELEKPMATRDSSGKALNIIANVVPNLIGGSADLAPSNKTYMNDKGDFSSDDRSGSNLHFGVREHAMAAIANGVSAHGGLKIFVSTFFVFSDYMKGAMRMSALMNLPVVYVLTHDSIGVGEDGPTHEPIEQLAALRSIPNLTVLRPCDSKETVEAWKYALEREDGPTALVLTRQKLPLYNETGKGLLKGAYTLKDSKKDVPDMLLMASGSEVELVYEAQEELLNKGIDSRVISVPSFELFDKQDKAYKESVMPSSVRARVAVEAASSFGWHKYTGIDGEIISIDHFGASAPAETLFEVFGFTKENVIKTSEEVLKNNK